VEGIQDTGVIARAELRRTVKSSRIVVLFALYALFSGLVLLVVGSISNAINETARKQIEAAGANVEQAQAAFQQARAGVLGFMFDTDPAMLDALKNIPLVVLFVFKITLFFLPAYVALMGFDQISGEVGPRSIRYLVVRSSRSAVLFGKYLAQAAALLILVLLVDVGIFAYARATNPDFGWGLLVGTLLKFWLAEVVFSLAYLALTTLCSTLFRSPAVSLVFNFLALFGLWMIHTIGGLGVHRELLPTGMPGPETVTSPIAALRYASPSHYSTDLLHPRWTAFAGSGLAYLCFAAIFLFAAWAVLRARDV
jgi:ABC-type transport system involved in multi-copper enzyme maturation permease subunit